MKYHYFLLKQDGSSEDLGFSKKYSFDQLREILHCTMIEILPNDYYENKKATLYGDEEGRFNSENVRNPHFRVLVAEDGSEWDVVGNIVVEVK